MAGTLTIAGLAMGLISGGKTIGPQTMTGTATIGQIEDAGLAVGDNTFAVPAGAYAVVVFLGQNAVSATIKARTNLNSADAGLPISPTTGAGYAVFPLPSGSTSLILNASTVVAQVELSFI